MEKLEQTIEMKANKNNGDHGGAGADSAPGGTTQRMFYENCKGHVEGHFFGGAERPHISGNFPDFCVEIFHKKLEGFQK